ncbi:flagellar hook-basal body complex protein FliE [Nitrosomonas ureae]|uniref:Flagellar hook-basal body complex protein FliE n=1 Tax=Nitrosomonas ureae TaxID=44577 RepID=A0A0S3AGQ3_9PROT|nr:flagellar hook-basal body complex protein FliE [Nitrosomonas ureae]ALQ50359.1 flagellar hook-basal body protein FliE [Nitrosomonas ureae]SDT87839.1 flagellar hook-basal body complex protein FliE [Nitrosomonas ureae]SEP65127.1 flagellar hook-basal body complex protein FliE [Nitrosomonas ureae]
MDKNGIDNILQQLQAASALASGTKKQPGIDEVASVDFSEKLKSAIDQVNKSQVSADRLSEQFVSDQSNVDLHEVMISLQKANVSFQSMVQVRNKLVTAYQEIMNMQV